MLKFQELTNPSSCLNRAREDEMVFVLLERDIVASATIRVWVAQRIDSGKNKIDDPQIQEALACADYMEARRRSASKLKSKPEAKKAKHG